MYDDNYETCSETYVSLRLYCDTKHPTAITKYLGIEPSDTSVKGEKSQKFKRLNPRNVWCLSSKGKVISKDSRRHIDYLLDKLLPIKRKLQTLQQKGSTIDIACFWLSEQGHGGPTLSPQQLNKLAKLGIEFWYDFYPIDNY